MFRTRLAGTPDAIRPARSDTMRCLGGTNRRLASRRLFIRDSRGPAVRDGDRSPSVERDRRASESARSPRGCETMSSDTNFKSQSEDAPARPLPTFVPDPRGGRLRPGGADPDPHHLQEGPGGGGRKKLTGLTAELIHEIMNDEAQHVPIIQNLLDDPDNPLPIPIRSPRISTWRVEATEPPGLPRDGVGVREHRVGALPRSPAQHHADAGVLPHRSRPRVGGVPPRRVAQLAPGRVPRAGFRPGRGADRPDHHARRGSRNSSPTLGRRSRRSTRPW